MKRRRKNRQYSLSYIKVMITIFMLNQTHDFANSRGLYKILSGIQDIETAPYLKLPTFNTYGSCTNRKIKAIVTKGINNGHVRQFIGNEDEEFYYSITDNGIDLVNTYVEKHGIHFNKSNIHRPKNIIHID